MDTPDREDLQIISRHSNISQPSMQAALKEFVHSGKRSWQQFLRLFFLSLGIGFAASGVIFFFAYNWDYLHKFVKLGIMEGLVIILTVMAVLNKFKGILKGFLLTAASIMVGVLFAVFGQVYQTGADAYDLFLNWTICITLWTIVAGFAPLWLIWIALVNITVQLFLRQQVAHAPMMLTPLLLFLINSICLVVALCLKKLSAVQAPDWFIKVLAIAAAVIATIGLSIGVFDRPGALFSILLLLVMISYAAGIYYGYRNKSLFYIAVTCCSAIVIICAFILNAAESSAGILLTFFFVAGSITMLIKVLLDLQKKWNHEKSA